MLNTMGTTHGDEAFLALLEDDGRCASGSWSLELFELALRGGSKKFVAHDYCEELLMRRWYGPMPRDTPYTNMFAHAVAELLRLFLSYLGHPADSKPALDEKADTVLALPVYRFLARNLLSLLFLCLYARVIWVGHEPTSLSICGSEWFLYYWGFTLFLDEWYQFRYSSNNSFSAHFDGSLWNVMDVAVICSVNFAAVAHALVRPLEWMAPSLGPALLWVEWVRRVVLAMGALPAFARLFALITLQQSFGVLFLSIMRMFVDIRRFIMLLSVVVLAFGLTFSGLMSAHAIFPPSDDGPVEPSDSTQQCAEPPADGMPSPRESFILSFWAIHGDSYGHEPNKMPNLVAVFLWVYFMLSQVVLVNLLVAIMGDTYQAVKDKADEEWKHLMMGAKIEHFELYRVPPPLNFFHLAPDFYSQVILRREGEEESAKWKEEQEEEKKRHRISPDAPEGAEDIRKRAKQVQLKLLKKRKQEVESQESVERGVDELKQAQREAADLLERMQQKLSALGR